MKRIHFEEINSTSSYLKENYEKYENLTFVSTDYQDTGHGRNNRIWFSEKGDNLLFSILIKDKDLFANVSDLSLASSVCIYNSLKKLGIGNISIKWPNDVYVGDRKIAGILLESVSYGKGIEAIVIGVGVNVNSRKFNEDLVNKTTSVYLEISKQIDLKMFRELVYHECIEIITNVKNGNRFYLSVVKDNNYLLGKKVYALINNKKELVEVIDINDDNSLRVKLNDTYINLRSGEVTFSV